jgi:hypothetical protein
MYQQLCCAQLRQSSIPVACPFSGSDHSYELPNLLLYRGVAPRPPRRRAVRLPGGQSWGGELLEAAAAERVLEAVVDGSAVGDRGAAEDDDEGAAVCAISAWRGWR